MVELFEKLLALASKSHLCCSEFQKNWYPLHDKLRLEREHDILVEAVNMLDDMKKYS
jgi:hypothetical protein